MATGFKSGKAQIIEVWRDIRDGIDDIIKDILQSISRMLSAVSSAVSSMAKSLSSFTSSASKQLQQTQTSINNTKKVAGFASGGYPTSGQLFYAREAGPELVGTIRGRTAVANNDQIVESISQGVYEAMSAAQGTGGGSVEVKLYLDGKQLAASVEKAQRQRGVTIYPGGVLSGV